MATVDTLIKGYGSPAHAPVVQPLRCLRETGKRWRVFSLQPKRATGGVATTRQATLHRRKKTCKIDQIQGT